MFSVSSEKVSVSQSLNMLYTQWAELSFGGYSIGGLKDGNSPVAASGKAPVGEK